MCPILDCLGIVNIICLCNFSNATVEIQKPEESMIVNTMTAEEIRREYNKDRVKLQPIVDSCAGHLSKKFRKSGRDSFQKASSYTINRNHYVVNYVLNKHEERATLWHYISNSEQPYFLASLSTDQGEEYYAKIDPHAILRYMERTPDYIPDNEEVFAKEAMKVAEDMTYFTATDASFITPSGLWPLASPQIVDGFLHIKTFIHKSMLNKRQTEIYKRGLKIVAPEAIHFFQGSREEFGIS